MALEQHIENCGYQRKRELLRKIKLNLCNADNDQSILIDPAGNLGKCEHHFNRNFFGHIDREEQDDTLIRKFRERLPDTEACDTCPCYPQCIRLVLCEDNICTPEWRKEKIYFIQKAMQDEYLKFINTQDHDPEA